MSDFSSFIPSHYTKLIFIGDSGCGKTGALVSLVEAGYKLRIIDLDDGLEALYNLCADQCPDKLSNVQYVTYTDSLRTNSMGQLVMKALPRAFMRTCKALDKWPVDDSNPAEWGPDHILVIDSLTSLSQYAYYWAEKNKPELKHRMHWIGIAQQCIMELLYTLTSDEFKANLIIISHIDYQGGIHESAKERQNLPEKGYVSSIGKALGPKIPIRFNTVLLSATRGTGTNLKRLIHTVPTPQLDLKNPAPVRLGKKPYPLETGLAEIFDKLKENKHA